MQGEIVYSGVSSSRKQRAGGNLSVGREKSSQIQGGHCYLGKALGSDHVLHI